MGTIGREVNPPVNTSSSSSLGITRPALPSIPDGVGHETANRMVPPEPRPPSCPECSSRNVLGYAEEVITDANATLDLVIPRSDDPLVSAERKNHRTQDSVLVPDRPRSSDPKQHHFVPYDHDSEHIGPGSFQSILADFVTRVRFVPRSPCCVLTSHHRIQDGAPTPDRSRSFRIQRHHSMPYGHSPRRDSLRDVLHLSHIHHSATNVRRRGHEWDSFTENPDLVHPYTSEPVQGDPSHDFVASMSSNNSVSNPPATETLPPHIYGFPLPTGTEHPSWFQDVYPHDFSKSRPDSVSRETIFPQNSGPLIRQSHSPHSTVSTVEQPRINYIQLSRSASQGPPLVINHDYVRYEMLAR